MKFQPRPLTTIASSQFREVLRKIVASLSNLKLSRPKIEEDQLPSADWMPPSLRNRLFFSHV